MSLTLHLFYPYIIFSINSPMHLSTNQTIHTTFFLPSIHPSVCRCLEEEGSLLDLEGLSNFPKSLDGLRKAASDEQPFDVKDIFNTSLESEALKETLYRQAKTQVCS